MITINNDIISVNEEYLEANDVLRRIVEAYGADSDIVKAAIFRSLANDALYAYNANDMIRKSGSWMVDHTLTRRLGDDRVVVIGGDRINHADNMADLNDFIEAVETVFGSKDPIEWILGATGSCLNYDSTGAIIYVGADVPDTAKPFVTYHEYKHWLDYSQRGIVRPRLAHADTKSSQIERECDMYALRRLMTEDDDLHVVEAAIEWMVRSHFRWEIDHPLSVSDLLHRAVLLYRSVREEFNHEPALSDNIKNLLEGYKE